MLLQNTTREAQCQMTMNAIIYILCAVSAILSVCSIVINIRRRRNNGNRKKKD